jgi:hypothetical protein
MLGLYLIGYLLYILIIHLANKKQKNTLNDLLKESKENPKTLD